MSGITANFFKDSKSRTPALDWLVGLKNKKVAAKFDVVIEKLEESGHNLSRPYAAYLRDKIYELRVKVDGVNYRMLYFFDKDRDAVITNGFTKTTAKVPNGEIDKAIKAKNLYESNPDKFK